MKLSRAVSLFVALAALLSTANTTQGASKNFVAGELLIKFRNGTNSPHALAFKSESGARVLKTFPESGWLLVKLPAGADSERSLNQFKNLDGVEYVQPNYIYRLTVTPNDPRFSELYGMQRISAPTAWDVTTGSQNVVVAVIDTGVNYNHQDLAANIWKNPNEVAGNGMDDDGNGYIDDVVGYDFVNNDADPADDFNHGTHVAGTIGAIGNNTVGVTGVNWNVRMMALKVHDAQGNSTSAKLIQAFNYVRMMRQRGVNIRITNNSYGGCPEACGYDQATKDAIDQAGDADILHVFAAGNNGSNNETTAFYPASYNSPTILSVASSDQNDNKSSFSNYGATTVDLAAPGSGILSTVSGSNSAYASFSGTSMAAPHVAGAAALLAAANPNLSAASLKATFMNRVDRLAQWNGIVKTGGRLNVASALQNQTVCTYDFNQTTRIFDPNGGQGTISVNAAINCDFSATTDVSWITVTGGNPGSGNTTVNFTVQPNLTDSPRAGAIKIAGQAVAIIQESNPPPPPPLPFGFSDILDFDGDGRTDFSAIQNRSGAAVWHNRTAFDTYAAHTFGLFTDKFVPADYDADGKTDLAVWRGGASANDPAYFYVLKSGSNTFQAVPWGASSDTPVSESDFDADGRADFAVTRKIGGLLYWYILQSTAGYRAVQFGLETDKPLRGDYDGDGKSDIAVYRPANSNPANTFFVLKSSGGLQATAFGDSTVDRVVSGDFDGDQKTDFAVFRSTNGTWYWLQSANGSFRQAQFGQNGDLPAPGDYDGDGRIDLVVWRPNLSSNEPAVFYLNRSRDGFTAFPWGQAPMLIPATMQNSF